MKVLLIVMIILLTGISACFAFEVNYSNAEAVYVYNYDDNGNPTGCGVEDYQLGMSYSTGC
jgi:hypothetical protein